MITNIINKMNLMTSEATTSDICVGCTMDTETEMAATSTFPPKEGKYEINFQRYLWIYVAPITFLVGVVGKYSNIIIIIIYKLTKYILNKQHIYKNIVHTF